MLAGQWVGGSDEWHVRHSTRQPPPASLPDWLSPRCSVSHARLAALNIPATSKQKAVQPTLCSWYCCPAPPCVLNSTMMRQLSCSSTMRCRQGGRDRSRDRGRGVNGEVRQRKEHYCHAHRFSLTRQQKYKQHCVCCRQLLHSAAAGWLPLLLPGRCAARGHTTRDCPPACSTTAAQTGASPAQRRQGSTIGRARKCESTNSRSPHVAVMGTRRGRLAATGSCPPALPLMPAAKYQTQHFKHLFPPLPLQPAPCAHPPACRSCQHPPLAAPAGASAPARWWRPHCPRSAPWAAPSAEQA